MAYHFVGNYRRYLCLYQLQLYEAYVFLEILEPKQNLNNYFENVEATVVIRSNKIAIQNGHVGQPDLRLTADGHTWLGFLAKE